VDYINAGHPPGILAGTETQAAALEATGPMISPAFSNLVWEQHTIPAETTRRIVLYTDGIIDAESEQGVYGLERLLEEIKNSSARCNDLSQQILHNVRQFTASRPIHDDLTLVVADL
jgi:serine phosphatase RsbU (regulator of sigma subunit)